MHKMQHHMFHKFLREHTFLGGKSKSDEDPFEVDVLELDKVDPGVIVVLGINLGSSITFGISACSLSLFHVVFSSNITSLEITKLLLLGL